MRRSLASVFQLSKLAKSSGIKYIAPFYHLISDEDLNHIWPLYDINSVEDFKNHLEQLSRDFEFISAKELLRIINGEAVNTKKIPAFLSFDDGLKECFSLVYPILKEKGIPATFFINPSFIKEQDIFYRYKVALIISKIQEGNITDAFAREIQEMLRDKNKLKYTLEEELLSLDFNDIDVINRLFSYMDINITNSDIYMTEKELLILAGEGFSIGAHGMNHANFELLDFDSQINQISESLDYCQSKFEQEIRLFAFPFYDYNLPARLYNKMYGELKVDLSFGTSGIKKDAFSRSVQRLDMENGIGNAGSYVKEELMKYMLKKFAGRHIIHR